MTKQGNPEDVFRIARMIHKKHARNEELHLTTIREALDYIRKHNWNTTIDADEFNSIRAAVRLELLSDELAGTKQINTYSYIEGEYTTAFSGYGDSGSLENTGNDLLDYFFDLVVEQFVDFDWYNNEGGGGDITWDIHKDILIVNGYENITTTHEVMTDVEI